MIRFRLLTFSFLIIISFTATAQVKTGADRLDKLLPLLAGKRVGLIVNHTSLLSGTSTHLLDTLVSKGVDVRYVFAPEHGFRGDADAGEHFSDGKDRRTGVPIVSVYGKNKRPAPEQMAGLDVLLFDIQDVGARFYTYISTLFHAMTACSESGKTMLVLDRPNPNDYIDGPVIDESLKSFVGAVSVPVLHGLTVGELARMIQGEKWAGTKPFPLEVVPMKGWKHGDFYHLPVKPSPNLPNDQAIKLYPSLCFFEATNVSIGRGTHDPFQVIGYPDKRMGSFSFTPVSLPGFDKNPLQKDTRCYGVDLRKADVAGGLDLSYFLDFYRRSGLGDAFISRVSFFDLLMGDKPTRESITAGKSESEIKALWKSGLDRYKQIRKKYLIYPDQEK